MSDDFTEQSFQHQNEELQVEQRAGILESAFMHLGQGAVAEEKPEPVVEEKPASDLLNNLINQIDSTLSSFKSSAVGSALSSAFGLNGEDKEFEMKAEEPQTASFAMGEAVASVASLSQDVLDQAASVFKGASADLDSVKNPDMEQIGKQSAQAIGQSQSSTSIAMGPRE